MHQVEHLLTPASPQLFEPLQFQEFLKHQHKSASFRMHHLLVRLAILCSLLCNGVVWAGDPLAHDGALLLQDRSPGFQIEGDIQTLLTDPSVMDIAKATASTAQFLPTPALQRHPLNEGNKLWVRLRLQRALHSADEWTLNIPLPTVDEINFYQRDGTGQWIRQTSGDHLSQTEWSTRGLYPEFSLDLPAGVTREVYLEVHNFKHMSLPIRLSTSQTRNSQRQLEATVLGLMLGTLLTLMTLSLLRYTQHQDRADAFAAFYGFTIAIVIAQINGVLNAHVWSDLPQWGDFANSLLPVLGLGCAMLFVRELYDLSTRYDRYHAFLNVLGWATIASTLGFAFLDRTTADQICAGFMLFGTSVSFAVILLSWREGSPIGPWLFVAYLPQFLGLVRIMSESVGLSQTYWEMRYLISLSVSISVPILVYALGRVTHDRKQLQERASHLPTQDALTGLLNRPQFQIQLNAAHERVIHQRESVALALVSIRNYEHIVQIFGNTIGEQCLLRGVVKLQRILRDVDPAGRTGPAHFALLLEGVSSRSKLTERMVKLIGSGLIPLAGLTPQVALQFQVACVLLHEHPLTPEGALEELEALLKTMGSRTRRPIRYLEPQETQAATLESGH